MHPLRFPRLPRARFAALPLLPALLPLLFLACLLGPLLFGATRAAAVSVTVTDILGRTVTLERVPQRILLGEGHQLPALAMIDPDAPNRLVAWQGDLKRFSAATYVDYVAAYPGLADLPVVGQATPDSFSLEAALAARPDVVIFSGGYGPGSDNKDLIERFESAGIPVIVLDFWIDPIAHTEPSIRALGQLLNKETRAREFIDFRRAHLDRIAEGVAGTQRRPSVLLQAHTGSWDCCWVPGSTNFGQFIAMAGGRGLGAEEFSGRPWGQLTLERVLSEDPDVMIATGASYLGTSGGAVLGPGVDPVQAQESFARALRSPGINALTAVAEGRAHGLWHLFHDTPLNFLAIEAFARWIHPEIFADVDPAQTLAELNERFLAVPMTGTFFVDAPR